MFGDYERDEVECGLTHKDIRDGVKCPRAYLEVPPLDITPHPEFSRYLFSYMVDLHDSPTDHIHESPESKIIDRIRSFPNNWICVVYNIIMGVVRFELQWG